MKQTRLKQFLLGIAFLLLGYANVMAQCFPGTEPSNFTPYTASTWSSDFGSLVFTNNNGDTAVINSGGGKSDKSDLRITVDAVGSIQIKFNNYFHFYNGIPAQDISGVSADAYNFFGLNIGGSAFKPQTSGANGNNYDPVSLSNVIGSGTTASPWRVKLVYKASYSGQDYVITEIISYVKGDKFVRRDRQLVIPSTGFPSAGVKVYDCRDAAFNQETDAGFGLYSTTGVKGANMGADVAVTPTTLGNSNGLNFVGITDKPLTSLDPNQVVLGLWEITPWSNWTVGKWNTTEYTAFQGGNNFDNIIANYNSDIAHNAQYADITSAGTYYFSVYEVVTSPCRPILKNDANTGVINLPVSGNVATNDIPLPNSTYSATASGSNPSGATMTMNADGTYTFKATTKGTYTYTVYSCNSTQTAPTCPTTTLTITVGDDPLNIATTTNGVSASPDYASLLKPETGSSSITVPVLNNDKSLNNLKTLAVTNVSAVTSLSGGPVTGVTATVSADGKGVVFETTSGAQPGDYKVTYTVCESPTNTVCKTETATLSVYDAKAPASIQANDDVFIVKGGSSTVANGNVGTNDVSTNGTKTVVAKDTTTAAGRLVLLANGNYTFTPNTSYAGGTISIPYTVCNGTDCSWASLDVVTTYNISLPVFFNELSAKIVNGQLIIDWSTLTEKNFDHFIVEVSNDGVSWKVLDKVNSKSLDGNSDKELKYSLTKSLSGTSSLFGVSFSSFGLLMMILLGIGLTISTTSRRKYVSSVLSLLLVISIIGTATSCKKDTDATLVDGKSKLFVRITTVDKDGKTEVSKVIQAVQE